MSAFCLDGQRLLDSEVDGVYLISEASKHPPARPTRGFEPPEACRTAGGHGGGTIAMRAGDIREKP